MSMYEQADKIRARLTNYFNTTDVYYTPEQREEILNIMIRFGQVAKFRCRSNTAYKNFADATFRDIAKIELVEQERSDGTTYTQLKAVVSK